jgi:hypothetical protein
MNSITWVILLIIAIIGISSIIWVRKYYDNKIIENKQKKEFKNYNSFEINSKQNIKNEKSSSKFNLNKIKGFYKEEENNSKFKDNEDSLTDSFKNMFSGEKQISSEEEISTKDFVKEAIGNPAQDMKNKVLNEFKNSSNSLKTNFNEPASLKKGSKSNYHNVETITPLKVREKEEKEETENLDKNQTTLTQIKNSKLNQENIGTNGVILSSEPMTEKQKNQINSSNRKNITEDDIHNISSEPMTEKQKNQMNMPSKEVLKNLKETTNDENHKEENTTNETETKQTTEKPTNETETKQTTEKPTNETETKQTTEKPTNETETKQTTENTKKQHKTQKIINKEGVVLLDETNRKDNVPFEEILKDKTYNQPNEDIDEIYEKINNTSYNFTESDDEIGKAFEGIDNASYQIDEEDYDEPIIPIYAEKRHLEENDENVEEDFEELIPENISEPLTPYENFVHKDNDQKKIENASNRIDKFYEKLSDINVNKIANKTKKVYSEGSQKIQKNINNRNKTKKTLEKPVKIELKTEELPNLEVPKEFNKIPKSPEKIVAKSPEKIKVNGNQIELRRGETVIFNHNGETYSSTILKTKPGQIYVTYRKHRIWISTGSVKKKF